MRAPLTGLALVILVLGSAVSCARDAAKIVLARDTNVYADSLAFVGPTSWTLSVANVVPLDITIATFTKSGAPCSVCAVGVGPMGTIMGSVDYLASVRNSSGSGLTDANGRLTVRWQPLAVVGTQQIAAAYNPDGPNDARFKVVTLTVTP